jgi:hypothetical protein
MKPDTQEKISGEISLLDLLNSPDPQREILLCLARHGPADAATLTQSTGLEPTQVQEALAVLLEERRVRPLANGQIEVIIGRAKGRTTLPAQLWQALATTDRLYSEQDIATLRTAIPILQFARARMVEFADHGLGHALRVKSYASQLGHVMGLNPTEQGLLRAAALFHDVGNAVGRERHNILSQETVIRLTADGELPFSAEEAEVVGLLCRWHRSEYAPNQVDHLGGEVVRTGLLASILRVADAMDIDQRRSDYSDRFYRMLQFFFPHQLPFWTSLKEILGVRVCCTPAVQLQVLTVGKVTANLQIAMLREDLDSTPLGWAIREIAVDEAGAERYPAPPGQEKGQALLVFPFEPHSLIMAALSRKHLVAAGAEIELLCYPDTAGGPAWLWGQVLPEIDPGKYDRLVVIGDRPDDGATAHLLEAARRWRDSGVTVSLLNRYEANWSRLPALLELGVEAMLGGDWAYFWGDAPSQADMAWGRIAALCTRDPTQSTVGLTEQEQAMTQGLLKVVYDSQPANDTAGWGAVATPILDLIQAANWGYFAGQAAGFAATYALPDPASAADLVEGRVLRFEQSPGRYRHASYWALEAAIERHGRALERGISFKAPYAIATWPEGDEVELLAINHWREEAATPIRLLYPSDLGPPPAGNECTIQVRLPAAQADEFVRRLLEACNRREA